MNGELTKAQRKQPFAKWIEALDQDVIQGEYGYEEGEFAVYPELWRPLWAEGLSPAEAFRRVLDAFDADRRGQEAARQAKWERIQREDAALLSQDPETPTHAS